MFGEEQYDETSYCGVSFVFGGQQYDETYWGEFYVWRAAV